MKPKYNYGAPCARCVPPRGRGAASRSPYGRPRGWGRGGWAGVAEKMFSRLMKICLLKIQDQTKGFKDCFAIDEKALWLKLQLWMRPSIRISRISNIIQLSLVGNIFFFSRNYFWILDLFIFISQTFEHVGAMWICVGKLHAEGTTLSRK